MRSHIVKEIVNFNKRTNRNTLLFYISKLEQTEITEIRSEILGYVYKKNNNWEIISFEFLNSLSGLGIENISLI